MEILLQLIVVAHQFHLGARDQLRPRHPPGHSPKRFSNAFNGSVRWQEFLEDNRKKVPEPKGHTSLEAFNHPPCPDEIRNEIFRVIPTPTNHEEMIIEKIHKHSPIQAEYRVKSFATLSEDAVPLHKTIDPSVQEYPFFNTCWEFVGKPSLDEIPH